MADGSIEIGKCSICSKTGIQLIRKYYHYGIKCECHSPDHFEIVFHCKDCVPVPPESTLVHIKPLETK